MAARSGHELRSRLAPAMPGSTTGGSRPDPGRAVEADATMFGELPDAVRLQMELVARTAASPAGALPDVIRLLVPGDAEADAAKRAAIVTAISTNAPLREQWERTWEVLRR